VVLHYVSLLFCPLPGRLTLDYDFPLSYSLFSPITALLSIAVIIGMLVIAFYTAKNHRLYSFCILWFLGNLVIESSIMPLEIAYEHRVYLPSMLAILLLVMFIHQIVNKRALLLACFVSVTLLFSYWTYERNKVWENDLTLWFDSQQKSPDKARTNQNLGKAYLDNGKVDEAINSFQRALQFYMQEIKLQKKVSRRLTSEHLRNLGSAYKVKGEYQKSIIYQKKALKEFSFDPQTYFDLGFCYSQLFRAQEAVYYFSTALRFSEHHSVDLSMQAHVPNIKRSLERAKKMAKEQEQR
jgi:tetratricopeptide (TPR) repeat protein